MLRFVLVLAFFGAVICPPPRPPEPPPGPGIPPGTGPPPPGVQPPSDIPPIFPPEYYGGYPDYYGSPVEPGWTGWNPDPGSPTFQPSPQPPAADPWPAYGEGDYYYNPGAQEYGGSAEGANPQPPAAPAEPAAEEGGSGISSSTIQLFILALMAVAAIVLMVFTLIKLTTFQLYDLDDDCLMEVLERLPPEQLFKMLRINKRMNRLAAIKIRHIKAIELTASNTFNCYHLHDTTPDQVYFCSSYTPNSKLDFNQPSNREGFLNLLTKCDGVKCIDLRNDFGFDLYNSDKLPDEFLMEVVRRCSEIECLKLELVKQDEWNRVLDLIGNKINHIVMECYDIFESQHDCLSTIAKKCPNIKQVDWLTNGNLTVDLLAAFKELPKSCRISMFGSIRKSGVIAFEDIFDYLSMRDLNISLLPSSVHRLSSLSCLWFGPLDEDVPGVEFFGLKKLQFSRYDPRFIHPLAARNLIACHFPCLEEFAFNATSRLNENDYEAMFRKMPKVKKLNILCCNKQMEPILPGSASIHQLKMLETIHLVIRSVPDNWQPKELFKQINIYVDEIKTLKKLTVDWYYCNLFINWVEDEIDKVKWILKKQNQSVVLVRV